jgi:hypothetical protein
MILLLKNIILTILLTSAPVTLSQISEQGKLVEALSEYNRYNDIATAIVEVSENSEPFDRSKDDVVKKAALIMSIALTESRLDKNIQFGISRGDRGKSWCLMQILIGNGKTNEGFTGPELASDLNKCLLSGYNIAKRSFGVCSNLKDYRDRLSGYTTGKCLNDEKHSRLKVNLYSYYYSLITLKLKKSLEQ